VRRRCGSGSSVRSHKKWSPLSKWAPVFQPIVTFHRDPDLSRGDAFGKSYRDCRHLIISAAFFPFCHAGECRHPVLCLGSRPKACRDEHRKCVHLIINPAKQRRGFSAKKPADKCPRYADPDIKHVGMNTNNVFTLSSAFSLLVRFVCPLAAARRAA
jgi:hypothetical protein